MAEKGDRQHESNGKPPSNSEDFARFRDVEYEIDVHIGEAHVSVGQLLQLAGGDLIRLDRRSSDNVLLRIDDVVVGEAEVMPTKQGTAARVAKIA
jgi:flagellar motor switch/type III secretory pathway protein FliN